MQEGFAPHQEFIRHDSEHPAKAKELLRAHQKKEIQSIKKMSLEQLEEKRSELLTTLGIIQEAAFVTPAETLKRAEEKIRYLLEWFTKKINPRELEIKKEKYASLLDQIRAIEQAIQKKEKDRLGLTEAELAEIQRIAEEDLEDPIEENGEITLNPTRL